MREGASEQSGDRAPAVSRGAGRGGVYAKAAGGRLSDLLFGKDLRVQQLGVSGGKPRVSKLECI